MQKALSTSGSALSWAWDHSLGWLLAAILILLIRAYQILISSWTPASCRFHPSCSSYGLGAIRTHGALKGTALTTWRIVRCNPWNGGGLDPVPGPGRWLPDVHPNGESRSGTMMARDDANTNV